MEKLKIKNNTKNQIKESRPWCVWSGCWKKPDKIEIKGKKKKSKKKFKNYKKDIK